MNETPATVQAILAALDAVADIDSERESDAS